MLRLENINILEQANGSLNQKKGFDKTLKNIVRVITLHLPWR